MLYPKNQSEKLDPALFRNPTAEYRCAPFWAWNCDLKKEELLKEIEFMKEMGMGGFHMHTRVGMSTKYLSDEFMDFIKTCNEKAKQENMITWLYDEDKWPSGFAGGYITRKKENRQKFLLLTVTADEAFGWDGSVRSISNAIGQRSGSGEFLAAYDVILDADGFLASYRRIEKDEPAAGVKWYAYLETAPNSAWFNQQSYVDTLSKSAMDEFIQTTHERYKEVVGADFGKNIPAIFTDEPQVSHKDIFDFAAQQKDVFIPFTTDFDETYRSAYGESLLDKLPEVFWEQKNTAPITRYRYHDHTTQRFTESFCDNLGAWCRKNNLMLTGHMMAEATLYSQTLALGEAMRAYRGFDLPGVDMLCDGREFTTVKQAASAAHQFGCCGVLSELYGVTNWDFDFRGHKTQGDWQAALGISVRVPHLYWVSMGGEAKRDYPASIGHQSAWYKEYSFIEDHFARVNAVMTRGKPDIRIGVVHPIESYWLHYGPNDQTSDIRNEMDSRFHQITDWLLYSTLDFDYICESLLPEQFNAEGEGFNLGHMHYDVVLVPACETLRRTTLDALKAFAAKGGQVIFMGDLPTMIDVQATDEGAAFARTCTCINWNKSALLTALAPYRTVGIRASTGNLSDTLVYGMRTDGSGKNLFIGHSDPQNGMAVFTANYKNCFRSQIDKPENYIITVTGEYIPTELDTQTGEMRPVTASYENGNTLISWQCYSQSSLLLRLEPGKTALQPQPEKADGKMEYLSGDMELILHEPNVCVLDMAQWKLEGMQWQPQEEMLRICNKAKETLGLSTAATHGTQPWVVEAPEPVSTITTKITFFSEVTVENVCLALEDFEITDIVFNGKPVEKKACGCYVDFSITKVPLGTIQKGENELILTKPFGVVSNVENVFLLGNFGTKVVGDQVTVTEAPKALRFGDWTQQGLAFYGGVATYRMKITGGRRTKLALGLYAAPCVTVELDGKRMGNASLAPYTVDLGALSEGEHTLDITVFASRVNTFGALHLSDYTVRWFGPGAWHTENEDWSYEYRITPTGLLTAPRLYQNP